MSKFDDVLKQARPDTEVTSVPKFTKSLGRRSDPNFVQANAYIPRDLHDEVKIALLKEGKRRQYSELVEELLRIWVSERT